MTKKSRFSLVIAIGVYRIVKPKEEWGEYRGVCEDMCGCSCDNRSQLCAVWSGAKIHVLVPLFKSEFFLYTLHYVNAQLLLLELLMCRQTYKQGYIYQYMKSILFFIKKELWSSQHGSLLIWWIWCCLIIYLF